MALYTPPSLLSTIFYPALPPKAAGRKLGDELWLALTLFTESSQSNEWPAVAAVIINRSRNWGYPGAYHGDIYSVVRQKSQFSGFNSYDSIEDEVALFNAVAEGTGFGDQNKTLVGQAVALAISLLLAPVACALLPPTVLNYWSPRSMLPVGSLPKGWNWKELHCFTWPGVAAGRFVFAQTVPAGSSGAGNQAQFAAA